MQKIQEEQNVKIFHKNKLCPHLLHPGCGPIQLPALGRGVSVLLVGLREGSECALPSKSASLPCSAV